MDQRLAGCNPSAAQIPSAGRFIGAAIRVRTGFFVFTDHGFMQLG